MKRLVHHVKRHYHEKYRERYQHRARWIFMFDSILVGIVLALLGVGSYFAFIYHPLRDDFRFEALLPEALIAGKETDVTIRVSNIGKRRLHNARIQAHLPENFRISKWPDGHDPVTFSTPIGTIAAGQSVDFTIRGTVFGPPGNSLAYVHMIASDDAGNPDERLFPIPVAWKDNLFGLEMVLPNTVLDGQSVHATIKITNGTDHRFDDVKLSVKWPEGFSVLASTPPVSKNMIPLGTLYAGEAVEAEVYGRYRGGSGSPSAPLGTRFEVSAMAIADEGGVGVILAETSEGRTSVATKLEFEPSLMPSTIVPGAEVPFTIRYRNGGAYTLRDVRFEVPLDPRVSDPRKSQAVFDSISELKPGAAGELSGTISVRPTFSPYVTNPKLTLAPTAAFSIVGETEQASTIAGGTAETKIRGTADIRAAARYYTSEGDQIGRGPLPPKAGQETRYWIFVSAENGGSDLSGARAEFFLPEGVRWTGRVTVSAGEEPMFDPERRAAVWEIGDVVAHAGASSDAPTASFEVALIPTTAQIGKMPELLSGTNFNATDAWTGETVTASSGPLTTAAQSDTYVRGRSKVQR